MRNLLMVVMLLLLSPLKGFQYAADVNTNYPYGIKEGGKTTLHLDNQTVHPWILGSYFQYLPKEDKVAYLNRRGSNIKLFDRSSGDIVKTVPLASVGPNKVGNEPSAFYWLNSDSIFVFSNLNNGRLSLIHPSGTKLKTYELQAKNDTHFVEVSEVSGGMVYSNGHLYLALRCHEFEKMPSKSCILSLEIASGKLTYIEHPLPVPEASMSKIPVDSRYSGSRLSYNKQMDQLIFNFPLSDNFQVRNEAGDWSEVEAKSVYFKELKFLKKPMSTYGIPNANDYRDELRFMPRYTSIVYDPYRKVYYRIGRLIFNKKLYLRRKSLRKLKVYEEFSIQVFNEKLEKVGENKFFAKGVLYEQGMFVDQEGLWLLCPQEENEDVMELRLMKLVKSN